MFGSSTESPDTPAHDADRPADTPSGPADGSTDTPSGSADNADRPADTADAGPNDPSPEDPLVAWLSETLAGVDAMAVLDFAARQLRTEAADGRRSSPDDVIALTRTVEITHAAHVLALGRFDASGAWRDLAATSSTTWLVRTTDAPKHQINRLITAGRITHAHRHFAQALTAGTTTVGHIAAVARAARNQRARILERDAEVLAGLATELPLEPYERAIAHWAGWADDELADTDAERADQAGNLTLAPTLGGWHLKGFLPTEDGELLRKLLDHHMDPPDRRDHPAPRTATQRRADALGTLIRRHARGRTTPLPDQVTEERSAAPPTDGCCSSGDRDHDTRGDNRDTCRNDHNRGTCHDDHDDCCDSTDDNDNDDSCDECCNTRGDVHADCDDGDTSPPDAPPDSPTPQRPPPTSPLVTVDVRVDLAHLLTVIDRDRRPPDQPVDARFLRAAANLPHLVPWTRTELERLLCDSWIGRVLVDGDSLPLDLGRRTRTFTAAQRRAITLAHPTCILCDRPTDDCQLHHMAEWDADHGPTDLANGIPLCPPDHRLLHLLKLHIHRDPDLTVTVHDRHHHPITTITTIPAT